MTILEIQDLRKTYRNNVVAIDNLSISIEGKGVYGFLGPNGSGKTTTIRCLLGLIKPTSGQVRLFGTDTTKAFASVVDRVGALVETPKFFPNFSGRKNLMMLAKTAGITSIKVDECIATVGLSERAKHKYRTYSLGMKQRLAIAATLLKDPDLIVLDEPANGLDPAGIVEIRQLIRELGESGKTVFVSSHQLAEVQQTCDYVTIISNGKVITSGSVDEIVKTQGTHQIVKVADAEAAATALTSRDFVVHQLDAITLSVEAEPQNASTITSTLAAQGIFLDGLWPKEVSLESVFLELTHGQGEL